MKKLTLFLMLLFVCGVFVGRANAGFNPFVSSDALEPDVALEWLDKYSPKIASDLTIIQSMAPDIYLEVLERVTMEVPEGEELRQVDPELFKFFMGTEELEVRSIRLGVQLAFEKDASKQEEMKAEIKSLVTQVFDQRLEQHQFVVAEIERELEELKRMGKVRKNNQDKVIRERYEYLINPDSEALEWW